ncbi:thioesterase domain-containing protein [Rhodopila globiformis]|nr:thioesterase domain-containing protein [Rhodopila globiformis]
MLDATEVPLAPHVGQARQDIASAQQAVVPSIVGRTTNNNSALLALFSRASRKSERVVIAVDSGNVEDDGRRPNFYCVHALSGAGGMDFCHLARHMPAVRLYGIQAPPARMADSRFGASVEAIADYYAHHLALFQPSGPFLLGGWSAGAIIALKIARNLRARGRDVDLLVAIDAGPENTNAGYPRWHPMYLWELVCNIPACLYNENVLRITALRPIARRIGSKAVYAAQIGLAAGSRNATATGYKVAGLIDLSRYPEDQQSFIKRLYNALLAYTPQTYPGRVIAYEARVKPLLHLPQVGRIWRQIAPRSIVVPVDGTHLSIMRDNHVRALAQHLQGQIMEIVSPGRA